MLVEQIQSNPVDKETTENNTEALQKNLVDKYGQDYQLRFLNPDRKIDQNEFNLQFKEETSKNLVGIIIKFLNQPIILDCFGGDDKSRHAFLEKVQHEMGENYYKLLNNNQIRTNSVSAVIGALDHLINTDRSARNLSEQLDMIKQISIDRYTSLSVAEKLQVVLMLQKLSYQYLDLYKNKEYKKAA